MMPRLRFDPGTPAKAYDLELSVLEALTPRYGYTWSTSEIAAVCGISKQAVSWLERRALAKLRVRLAAPETRAELREALRHAAG